MSTARTSVIFTAVILAGTLAGFFLTYSYTIMPGLATTDDRTFVGAFQGLERMFESFNYDAGVNWHILFAYPGLPLVTAVAVAQNRSRPFVWWLVAALALSIVPIIVSTTVNVPSNNALVAAGDPAMIDVAQVRADFQESTWKAWNNVRSATTLGAFVCLSWVLFLHGKKSS